MTETYNIIYIFFNEIYNILFYYYKYINNNIIMFTFRHLFIFIKLTLLLNIKNIYNCGILIEVYIIENNFGIF